jgi:hypothetical protein
MNAAIVRVPFSLITVTVSELRSARATERVLLWLGNRSPDGIVVRNVFVPAQRAESDYFRIPRHGIEELLQTLRSHRWMVAAQVHTHPEEAFHSLADDRWAIVRHAGALSLVVPRFCQETSAGSFTRDALAFRLTDDNEFVHVNASEAYRVTS